MTAKEISLIESASVFYSNYVDKWVTRGVINVNGYQIAVPRREFDNIDDAVKALKELISEIVVKFEPKTRVKYPKNRIKEIKD